MKIQFLGTAAAEGWPAIFCQCKPCLEARRLGGKNIRSRSSVLINEKCLVDFPPDSFSHALKYGIELGTVDQLLVTHSHSDHFYPEDLMMMYPGYAYKNNQDHLLNIWGNGGVMSELERVILREKEEGSTPKGFCQHLVRAGESFQAGDLTVQALWAKHKPNEESLLFAIRDESHSIFYANDSGWFPEKTWEQLANWQFDLVLFDCTCGPHSGGEGCHMGIPEALKAQGRLSNMGSLKPGARAIATHFSHNGGLLHEQLVETLVSHGFEVAYDGLIIQL